MKFSSFNLKHLSQLLILCASLLFINNINAAEAAAKVLFAQGQVEATSNDDTRALNKGDDIFAADSIATGASSKVQMRFTDGGMLALRANTVFAVSSYVSPDEQQEGSLSFRLVTGGLRTVTGSIGKTNPENYEIKTSVATLGIRGTEFIAEVENDTLRVHVGEGEVFIYNGAGELSVQAGQNAIVRLDERPEYTNEAPQFNGASIDDQGGAEQHAAAEDEDASQSLESATQAATGIEQNLPSDMIQHQQAGEPGFALFRNGQITVGDLNSLNVAQSNSQTVAGLTWGYALNPSGASSTIDYIYIHGPAVTNMPISGVLNYSLVSGQAWGSGGSEQDLSAFDMSVSLNGGSAPQFKVAQLTVDSTTYSTNYTAGFINSNGAFQFSSATTTGDELINIGGIFSGNGAENAGVVFDIQDTNDVSITTGAAVLQR